MHNKSKRRPYLTLQYIERKEYRQDVLRTRSGIRPISEKTIAKVFVNYSLLILDDLFATKNPRSNKHVQVFSLQLAAQRRKTANVRDQEPTGNILELPQRPLHHVRLVFLRNGKWLAELENLIADCDLIA